MTQLTRIGAGLHAAAVMYAEEHKAGQLSRREFLTRTTALGVSATAAYGLLGLNAPAMAEAHATAGGTLRMEMETKAIKDPRTADWSQIANFTRGWLEYLVEYENDGSPARHAAGIVGNQRRRDRIHPACPARRDLEQRRRLYRR